MKAPIIVGLIMLAGAVLLVGMPLSNSWPTPLIVPGTWLAVIGMILLIGSLFEHHSYKMLLDRPPSGFTRTEECFVDTRTGKPVRVYFDAATGERAYVIEAGGT